MIRLYKNIPKNNLKRLGIEEFTFPAGEVSVKLNATDLSYLTFGDEIPNVSHQTIVAHIEDSEDVMKLLMVKDALQRIDSTPIRLFMPYIPYARQDRICDGGEAFSLKVFANLINSQNFQKVTVVDPHSLVAEALIDRVEVIPQVKVINYWLDFTRMAIQCTLVSPDAGANKKTADIAKYFEHSNFIRADKLRDLTNGQIKETVVHCDDLKGKDVVIVDDICERGGTFLGLAKALKQKNCGKIHLYVTHGIFGGRREIETTVNKLLSGGIDQIWTTNSYHADLEELKLDRLNVMNLQDRIEYKL